MINEAYIDTHIHLYDEAFDSDFDEVLDRIRKSGVVACILPAIDRESYPRQTALAEKCGGFVYEAMGLHPTSVGKNWEEELAFVKQKLAERNSGGGDGSLWGKAYVAVGEIGLDGYWSREFMQEQKMAFREQVVLAKEYGLPVIVHAREATGEIFEVLDSVGDGGIRGVFHAFSGSAETYRRLKKYGDLKVGIGGVVTYKNAGIARALEQIPLSDIVLETDAPWLAPVPYRGKRNESTYLAVIAGKIAEIKGCTLREVAEVTTANAGKLFGI